MTMTARKIVQSWVFPGAGPFVAQIRLKNPGTGTASGRIRDKEPWKYKTGVAQCTSGNRDKYLSQSRDITSTGATVFVLAARRLEYNVLHKLKLSDISYPRAPGRYLMHTFTGGTVAYPDLRTASRIAPPPTTRCGSHL